MAAPKNEIVQMEYQNPHAQNKLRIPVLVLCNTSDEDLERNIRANTALPLEWLSAKPEHDGVAVFLGGGASIKNDIDKIKELQDSGAVVFAMNAASQWARTNGIEPDYQVIADAKDETSTLVDPLAKKHLIASQVSSKTMAAVDDPILWHLEIGGVERFFPDAKVLQGGYTLIGGGASVGNSAICIGYAMGFRELHIFGYDSSHTDNKSHAYSQPMNNAIPCTTVNWGGRDFKVSVAMKAQAEKFQMTSQQLKQLGCKLHVYGDGLLQTMYHTEPGSLSEREKYQLLWQTESYREVSPGESQAKQFLEMVKPEGLVIDFGCGTGRAGLIIKERGDVLLMDFTDNCRDQEAQALPFLQWDLTNPIPSRADTGYCTDVMEHIPPEDVATVISNIMEAAKTVYFQISTTEDHHGVMVHDHLHLTVRPHKWWSGLFTNLGYQIAFEQDDQISSIFLIKQE